MGETLGKSRQGSLQARTRATTASGPHIAMYMPPTVSESYGLRYNDHEIGPAITGGSDIYEHFKNQEGEFVDALTDFIGNNNVDGLQDAVNAKANAMLKALPGGVAAADAVAINRGIIFTPKMELMFEGLTRRQFAFSFIMMPSSKEEADMINEIIYQFKLNSAPDYADALGMQMTIPDRWTIEYYNTGQSGAPSTNGYLTKIDECFLETINVTYGGDKYVAHEPNETGAPPTRVVMQLTFRELDLQTKELISKKNHTMPTSNNDKDFGFFQGVSNAPGQNLF